MHKKRRILIRGLAIVLSVLTLGNGQMSFIFAEVTESVAQVGNKSDQATEWNTMNKAGLQLLELCNENNLKGLEGIDLEPQNKANLPAVRQTMKEFIKANITKDITSDYDKAKAIFVWINSNIVHGDTRGYTGKIWLDPYEIYKEGQRYAVCGGYANLMKAMCAEEGIPAVVVTGPSSGGGHAWDAIYADNRWFYVDPTWGGNQHFDWSEEKAQGPTINHCCQVINEAKVSTSDGIVIGFDNGIAVVDVTKDMETVQIPDSYSGLPITAVGTDLFRTEYTIKNIHIPRGIERILGEDYDGVLEGFQVDLDNSRYSSQEGVLMSNDRSIIIAYPGARKTPTFTLTKELLSYDEKNTFSSQYLTDILVEDGNPNFTSYNGCIYNKDKSKLLTVPNGKTKVEVLGSVTLDNTSLSFKKLLKEVELKEGIATIPTSTFINTNLTKLTLPESLVSIENNAFTSTQGMTIYGKSNSYAATYAQKNNITFVATDISTIKNGWVQEEGGKRYYNNGTLIKRQWIRETEEISYYVDENGFALYGRQSIENKEYYFGTDGVMQKGKIKIGEDTFYFGADGTMQKGMIKVGEDTFYFGTDGSMQRGVQEVDGKIYDFGTVGNLLGELQVGIVLNKPTLSLEVGKTESLIATVTPLELKDKSVIWKSSNPNVATVSARGVVTAVSKGTATITAETVNAKKIATCMITVWEEVVLPPTQVKNGWIQENGRERYYKDDVLKANYWVPTIINGKTQYFFTDSEGYKSKGWIQSGCSYYMDPLSFLMKRSCWIQNGVQWHYVKDDGKMATGWLKSGSTWYFLDKTSGVMKTGWIKDGSSWYYLVSSGKMATGWIKDGSSWYYLASSGKMATGWIKDGSSWYYLASSGKMTSGWLKVHGAWYYLKASGQMATGWVKVNGKEYYLIPGTGKMAVNTWIGRYYVNEKGQWSKTK